MDYIRGINEMDESYLEIKIFKPSAKPLQRLLEWSYVSIFSYLFELDKESENWRY